MSGHYKAFILVFVALVFAVPSSANIFRPRQGGCPKYSVPPLDLQKLLETRLYYPLYLSSDGHAYDKGCECNWVEFQKPASPNSRVTFAFDCVKPGVTVPAATRLEGEVAVFNKYEEEEKTPGLKPEGRLRLRAKGNNGPFSNPFDIIASADDLSWFIAYGCSQTGFDDVLRENVRLLVSGDVMAYYNTKEGRRKLKKIMQNAINKTVKGLRTQTGIKFNETQKSQKCAQKRAELALATPVSPR